jgi:aerobic carbon-monoxide dehydrogenase medium subunit
LKPAPFEYVAPGSVEEALSVLQENVSDGRILAGGQSLLPLLNLRLAKPKVLIDLNCLSGLDGIHETVDFLSIGAMTRQSNIERSTAVQESCPLLAEAIRHIGHVAIRHRGTIGGSLAHNDPAAELPAVALVLDAEFEIVRRGETRTVAAEDFFVDYFTTVLAPDEMLQKILLPPLKPSSGYALEEITRRHGDFAIAGVAVVVDLDDSATIRDARIALFGVAPTAVRARAAEEALQGQKPDADVLRGAAALLSDTLDPPSDIHASSAYRKRVAAVLTARALERAVRRSRERRVS